MADSQLVRKSNDRRQVHYWNPSDLNFRAQVYWTHAVDEMGLPLP